jgi:hypothetical protein
MPEDELEEHILLTEVDTILTHAETRAVTLRLLGALAIRIHSKTARSWADKRPLTDLDFLGYRKDRKQIEDFLPRIGYKPSQTFNMLHGDERLMFFGLDGRLKVDVWLEVFRMAHTFNFFDRLPLDKPTLPLSDLLMTKLQIVELNEKDVRDVICLFVDHDLSENDTDRERINVNRLVAQCRESWGVHRTFTMNLGEIRRLVARYADNREQADIVTGKIDKLINEIEKAPKTLSWKMRARVGDKKRWYDIPDVR